jgi:hypothetical protein
MRFLGLTMPPLPKLLLYFCEHRINNGLFNEEQRLRIAL